jgi:hypothetical protein
MESGVDLISKVESDPNLPPGILFDLIKPFLLPLPSSFADDPGVRKVQLTDLYRSSEEALSDIESMLEEKLSKITFPKTAPEIPSFPVGEAVQKAVVLRSAFEKFRSKMVEQEAERVGRKHLTVVHLRSLVLWLQNSRHPVIPDLERLQVKRDKGNLAADLETKQKQKYRALKLAFKEELNYLGHIKRAFGKPEEALNFFRGFFMTEKVSECILYDGPGEVQPRRKAFLDVCSRDVEKLFQFFEWSGSPLVKAHLVPLSVGNTFDDVSHWIERASSVLQAYDSSALLQGRAALFNLLVKYVFERTFPDLENEPCEKDSEVREKISGLEQTYADVNVDQDCINFLNLSYYLVSPVESLTCLELVLREFETKVDGYDSLFNFGASVEGLVPVLVKSSLREVKRFFGWLRYWSRLESVSADLNGALSMFEAVVAFIEKSDAQNE